MAQRQGQMDEKTIWDDSALVDSWNEALEEYKKYHSIQAKGGSIRDLDDEQPRTTAFPGRQDGRANDEPNAPGIKREEQGNGMSAGHQQMDNVSCSTIAFYHYGRSLARVRCLAEEKSNRRQTSSTGADDLPPNLDAAAWKAPLQPILGSVQDENLKRLLIAWYYAGYYTGLTEGSQKTQ